MLTCYVLRNLSVIKPCVAAANRAGGAKPTIDACAFFVRRKQFHNKYRSDIKLYSLLTLYYKPVGNILFLETV